MHRHRICCFLPPVDACPPAADAAPQASPALATGRLPPLTPRFVAAVTTQVKSVFTLVAARRGAGARAGAHAATAPSTDWRLGRSLLSTVVPSSGLPVLRRAHR